MWFEYIIITVVVAHLCWSWFCCKKAKEAYAAAEKLYKWVKVVHAPLICTVNATESCKDAGPEWPPDELGEFPPED